MDPLALLAAVLHVQMRMTVPMSKCVALADGILAGAECEAAIYRAKQEADEKAAQPPAPVSDKVM
jgi:hypothetical protein